MSLPDQAALELSVTGIFRRTLNLVPPSVDTDLFATGALDSLLLVDLLVQLEQYFSIRIPLEQLELEHFRTLTGIARFVGHCLREQDVTP